MLAPPPFDVVATPTLSVSGSIAGGVYGSHLGGAAGNWLYNFITNSRSAPQTQPLQNPNNE